MYLNRYGNELPSQIPRNQYTSGGGTTFNYTFLIPDDSSIAVYVTPPGEDPDQTLDLKILNVDYNVTGAGVVSGGTVVFLSGHIPDEDSIITLVRDVPYAIETQFAQSINFNGQNLDDVLENIVLMIQQLASIQNTTSLKYQANAIVGSGFPPASTLMTFPTEELSILVWDGTTWVSTPIGGLNPDLAAFIAALAQNQPEETPGAQLVGFYDEANENPTTVNEYLLNQHPVDIVDGVLNAGYFVDATPMPPNPTINYVGGRSNGQPLPTEILDGTQIEFQPLYTNGANPTLTIPLQDGPGTAYPIILNLNGDPLPPGSLFFAEGYVSPKYTLSWTDGQNGWVIDHFQLLQNEAETTQGAQYIGYYNPVSNTPTTVQDQLDEIVNLPPQGVYLTPQELSSQTVSGGSSYNYPTINYTPQSASSTIEVEVIGNVSGSGNINGGGIINVRGSNVASSSANFLTDATALYVPLVSKAIFTTGSLASIPIYYNIGSQGGADAITLTNGWLTIKEYV